MPWANCGPADALRNRFCLKAIRQDDRDAEIVLVVDSKAAALFERSPFCDRIVVSRVYQPRRRSRFWVSARKLIEILRLAREVGRGYDVVLMLDWGSTLLNLLGWFVGRRTVGYANRFPFLLSCNLGPYDHSKTQEQRNLALLDAIGIKDASPDEERIVYRPADHDAVGRLLAEHRIEKSTDLVVIHPGSDWACQQWLVQRWAELADALVEKRAATLVFTGTASERNYNHWIRQRMRAPSVDLAGRTTLPELQALLARARLCVCVDSVAYNLALAVGIPVVVLGGKTNTERPISSRRPLPIVVDKITAELKTAIRNCRGTKKIFGSCHDYVCPMAGLQDVSVLDVLLAVERAELEWRVLTDRQTTCRGEVGVRPGYGSPWPC